MKGSILVAAVLMALSGTAFARCPGDTQVEMNQCAADALAKEKAEMYRIYNQAYAKLDSTNQAILKRSQVSWIRYMRSWCTVETYQSEHGSIRPMEIGMCQEGLTKSRAKQLMDFYSSSVAD